MVTITPSLMAAGNRSTTRRSVDTTPTATETAKQHPVEAQSITQRAQDTTRITDPQKACGKCGGNGYCA